MSELLLEHLRSRISITDQEFKLLIGKLELKKVKKKEILLRIGEVCNYTYFVTNGLLYSFSTDLEGNEHVIHFAWEDFWISNLYSFINRTPSQISIVALEDSELYLLRHDVLESIFSEIPGMERFHRILFQKAYTSMQQRLDCTLSVPAVERYIRLLEENPQILQRIPLHLIASYLGITPESLSRIRRKLMTKP
ncbi:Crp/Fnr family transcriptional regulator [Apibacter raozihei]|uniref:Crp/Fnr family transcriptional regulator n=1 Tax=Apibacter raozihei TaxID=2500547 RepID=UPI000FE35B28|nr:Crp/Fnr family transcriptional regulator [Apibacter raozihei]